MKYWRCFLSVYFIFIAIIRFSNIINSNKVSFISTTAHQRFMEECHQFIIELSSDQKPSPFIRSDKSQMLKEEIDNLHRLAEEYQQNFSRLPKLVQDYNALQHRIKVNMRQLLTLQKKMERKKIAKGVGKASN